jgi:hypothetical protein
LWKDFKVWVSPTKTSSAKATTSWPMFWALGRSEAKGFELPEVDSDLVKQYEEMLSGFG